MFLVAVPVLHVGSSEAAKRFYCDHLGFSLQFAWKPDESHADPCYMGMNRDGAIIHVSSFPGDGVSGSVAYFQVDDVDHLYNEFVGKGVHIDLAPTNEAWGMREMCIVDPDGNQLRFGQICK